MEKYIVGLVLSCSIFSTQAEVKSVYSETEKKEEVDRAGIYFNADVTASSVASLMAVVTELSVNQPALKNIDLYINSDGGEMNSGYAAYEFIKGSKLNIRTINNAITASAATMIYCASEQRFTLPYSVFIIHPAKVSFSGNESYLAPDELRRIYDSTDIYNTWFKNIYAKCTKLNPGEIERATHSEFYRVQSDTREALKNGLVNKGIKQSEAYPVTYFITN